MSFLKDKLQPIHLTQDIGSNPSIDLMNQRLQGDQFPHYHVSTVEGANHMTKRLAQHGGMSQQQRMIRDKRRSLDWATLNSYQGALVRKYTNENDNPHELCRALINPNRLKLDYDDKIISIGFEHNFQVGDIFEWCNTDSYWMIYLQDLQELAYFKGEIRKCNYEITWADGDGVKQTTYAAVVGPHEKSISSSKVHGMIIDNPNYSLELLIQNNSDTRKYFTRYARFFLNGINAEADGICWRVEGVDSISDQNLMRVYAKEYYANEQTDDIENGIVDGLVEEPVDPNPETHDIVYIMGETFIRPKKEYEYTININLHGKWQIDKKYPVTYEVFQNAENGADCIKLKWTSTYSGQFDLVYSLNTSTQQYTKTIVVESLY